MSSHTPSSKGDYYIVIKQRPHDNPAAIELFSSRSDALEWVESDTGIEIEEVNTYAVPGGRGEYESVKIQEGNDALPDWIYNIYEREVR